MRKKTKKVSKIKPKAPTLMDRLPLNQGEWLMLVIKNTISVLGDHYEPSYDYLENQLDRLEKELKAFKLANPTVKLRDL